MSRVKLRIDADPGVVIDYKLNPLGHPSGLIIQYGHDIAFAPPEPAPPVAQRGKPRIDYARVYCVIPQDATEDRAIEIFREGWRAGKRTIGGSNDDAGIGDLSDRTAILYDIPDERHAEFTEWYARNYPGVKVIFS